MNNDKNKLIPELRFLEFKNDGEWKENKLGDCLLQNPEYGINAPSVPFSSELPLYLRITDISEDGRFLSNSKVSVDRDVTENNYLQEGDIVLARTGASVGKSYKYKIGDGRLVFAGFLIRVKPDSNKLNSELLFQFLSTNRYWKWVNFISARSGQPGINGVEYASLPIILPPKPTEQKKIADCLSSIDELVSTHTHKLQTLKTYKKGLMQNLFPQQGEKVPKLRFKEFEKDGVWKKCKLGEIGKFSKGKGISKSDIDTDGKFECIRYGELYTTYGEVIDDIVSKTNLKTNELVFSEANDVILPSSGETQIDIAKASCIIKKGVAIGGDINIFKSKLNGGFLSYYLNSSKKMEIAKLAQGISVVHLYSSQLETLNINYPISKDNSQKEQQKIAETLSSLDNLIKEQSNNIEQLKSHKKGLMQGLFPKVSTN